MNFPTTIHLLVQSQQEYDAVMAAFQHGIDNQESSDGHLVSAVIERAKVSDGSGIMTDLPEAWIEIGGKRMADGRRSDLNTKFDVEVASHKASVVLYARDPGNSIYRVVRSRRSQNIGI